MILTTLGFPELVWGDSDTKRWRSSSVLWQGQKLLTGFIIKGIRQYKEVLLCFFYAYFFSLNLFNNLCLQFDFHLRPQPASLWTFLASTVRRTSARSKLQPYTTRGITEVNCFMSKSHALENVWKQFTTIYFSERELGFNIFFRQKLKFGKICHFMTVLCQNFTKKNSISNKKIYFHLKKKQLPKF